MRRMFYAMLLVICAALCIAWLTGSTHEPPPYENPDAMHEVATGSLPDEVASSLPDRATGNLPDSIADDPPHESASEAPTPSIDSEALLKPTEPGIADADALASPDPGEPYEEERIIDPSLPMVAVTYDDGPHRENTEKILDILEEHMVVATFFVAGGSVNRQNSIISRAFEMGNEIANHSMSHQYPENLTSEEMYNQIFLTNERVEAVTGVPPQFFRPPYGEINADMVSSAEEIGLPIMLWTIDPRDYTPVSSDDICKFVMDRVEDGSVILLHDIQNKTVGATAKLVPALLKEGYQLVTMSELFYYNDVEYEPGRIYNSKTLQSLFCKR